MWAGGMGPMCAADVWQFNIRHVRGSKRAVNLPSTTAAFTVVAGIHSREERLLRDRMIWPTAIRSKARQRRRSDRSAS